MKKKSFIIKDLQNHQSLIKCFYDSLPVKF